MGSGTAWKTTKKFHEPGHIHIYTLVEAYTSPTGWNTGAGGHVASSAASKRLAFRQGE